MTFTLENYLSCLGLRGNSLYKLLNRLFGWDYIQWANTCAGGVARVHHAGGGKVFYWRYKSTGSADIIRKADQVIWLTCEPSKYIK